jgi:hypothetical protein
MVTFSIFHAELVALSQSGFEWNVSGQHTCSTYRYGSSRRSIVAGAIRIRNKQLCFCFRTPQAQEASSKAEASSPVLRPRSQPAPAADERDDEFDADADEYCCQSPEILYALRFILLKRARLYMIMFINILN